jgi:outer membrane protein assembly factor BamB
LVVGSLLVACRPGTTPGADGECTKDSDCSEGRICVQEQCTDSARSQGPLGRRRMGAARGAGVAHEPPSWARGGPAGHDPFFMPGVGPTRAPKVLWDVDLGAVIFARPTVRPNEAGSAVAYVGTHAGRFVGVVVEGSGAGQIVLDLDLGGIVWSTAAADERGRLYVGADNDTLFAIDPGRKEILWSRRLGDCEPSRAPGPEGVRCDVDGGPTLGPDGDLHVGADGVYRISPEGEVRWHWPTTSPEPGEQRAKHVFSTPVVTSEGLVIFGSQDGFVTAVDGEGTQLWRHRVGADVDGTPAVGLDGTIYVGADDGSVHALHPDGSVRWRFMTQRDIRSGIAVGDDGTLFVGSFDGHLYGLDPDGNVRWMVPTGGPIASSPVIDASGTIFFGSRDERLYAVRPTGDVSWVLDFPARVDSSVSITPAGTLVVGCDDGHLRALR